MKGKYVIRFTVTSRFTTNADILEDWAIIRSTAYDILRTQEGQDLTFDESKLKPPAAIVQAAKPGSDDEQRKREFMVSLLLSNSPLIPKFINGSFAAIFENRDVNYEFFNQLSSSTFGRRSPSGRRYLSGHRQYSLDSRIDYLYDYHNKMKLVYPNSKLQEIEETDDQNGDGITPGRASPRRTRSLSLGQEDDLTLQVEEATVQDVLAAVQSRLHDVDIQDNMADEKPLSSNGPTEVRCLHCGHILDQDSIQAIRQEN